MGVSLKIIAVRACATFLSLMSFAAWSLAQESQPAAASSKPNIVLIVADDLGYADVGFQGCTDIPTPNLDALAAAGVRCTNAYVSAPVCSPSRAGLITGRYQQRFGYEFNLTKFEDHPLPGLPDVEITIAERLRSAGYVTGMIGKWHLGRTPQLHPLKQGFDEFFGYVLNHKHGLMRGRDPIEESEYITDALAREAVDFIDRHKEQTFFLSLAFTVPHMPLEAPQELLSKFESINDSRRRVYAAMVFGMDQAIGRLIDKLRAAGLGDNSLIVFLSDNGGPTAKGSGVNGSQNTPLNGSKGDLHEGGIRVPMVLAWRNRLPAGTTYDRPIIHLDLMPTFLAAAGVQIDPAWNLDGVNLLPFLEGTNDQPPHEFLFWRFGEQWAVRKGDWKLVKADDRRRPKLYNLRADIGETHDVSEFHGIKADRLQAAWKRWNRELPPPAWPQDPDTE
jgi:arylsulfatase A-like enzyme